MILAQAETRPEEEMSGASPAETGAPQPAASPVLADGIWMCQAQKADSQEMPVGPLEQPLTVGEKFILTCEGATVPLDSQKLTLRLPQAEKYSVRLLRVHSLNENKGVFTATSYRVGEGQVRDVVLTDGIKSVELRNIDLKLQSSIDPATNPEGKPFAPPVPLAITWPIWLWATIGGVLFLLTSICFMIIRRRTQRKALMAELERHGTALTPYHQFNKDLRQLAREFPMLKPTDWTHSIASRYIDELNRHFRWYLSRQFTVPAFQWSDQLILREIKKRHRAIPKSIRQELRLALRELNKGMGARETLSALDGQQLVELCRKVADDVEQTKTRKDAFGGAR
ncbi:MAG: hypothetical protein NDI61_06570 [Bdellovibrionaceae bacterium]|nr:hypothetical protein [Pseudobdellovibrionaceae bacterium]